MFYWNLMSLSFLVNERHHKLFFGFVRTFFINTVIKPVDKMERWIVDHDGSLDQQNTIFWTQ